MGQSAALQGIAAQVESDPDLRARMQADPAATLRDLAPVPSTPVYLIVVRALAAALLICLVLAGAAMWRGEDVPEVFVSIASLIVGAMAGLLAPQP